MKLLKTRTRKDLDVIADILDGVTEILINQHNRIVDLEEQVDTLVDDKEHHEFIHRIGVLPDIDQLHEENKKIRRELKRLKKAIK